MLGILKSPVVLALLIWAAFLLSERVSANGGEQDTVRARRFELVGPQGLDRGSWYVNDEGETVFDLRIRSGSIRILASAGGNARIELTNEGAKHGCSAVLGVSERGDGRLALRDQRGIDRAAVSLTEGGRSGLDLRDDRDIVRATMYSKKVQSAWRQSIYLAEEFGRVRVGLGSKDGGSSWFRLVAPHPDFVDSKKRARLLIESALNKAPSVEVFGPEGKLQRDLASH